MKLETLKQKMDAAHYIYDDTLATVLTVALQLGRPLLIEGAAGVGKTEVAKVMASALDRELVRLQCYEGLDQAICQAIENRGDFGAKGRQTSNGLLIQERIPLE